VPAVPITALGVLFAVQAGRVRFTFDDEVFSYCRYGRSYLHGDAPHCWRIRCTRMRAPTQAACPLYVAYTSIIYS